MFVYLSRRVYPKQVDAKGAVTHQVFEQWVVLVDSSDIGASGVQG